jgi:protocatechuate 3,4-dioxygenase, beta subunit
MELDRTIPRPAVEWAAVSFRSDDREIHPPLGHPAYRSTQLRAPQQPPIRWAQQLSETTGPSFAALRLAAHESDLTRQGAAAPLGERIVVAGQVRDEDGRPLAGELVEIWQANAAGRYVHLADQHDAPLDPNFIGAGRCLTDGEGVYRFLTVKPGAYSWRNHANAWRPNHIHLSLLGPAIASRLVTQMYFPGDPLLAFDPIFLGVPGTARERLVARFSLEATQPEYALGFVFDIVLRGAQGTPMETPFAS